MKTLHISKLSGRLLDYAVAVALGRKVNGPYTGTEWVFCYAEDDGSDGDAILDYSQSWEEAGKLVEKYKLEIRPGLFHSRLWSCWGQTQHGHRDTDLGRTGKTPVEAIMRWFVAHQAKTLMIPVPDLSEEQAEGD